MHHDTTLTSSYTILPSSSSTTGYIYKTLPPLALALNQQYTKTQQFLSNLNLKTINSKPWQNTTSKIKIAELQRRY